MDMDMATDEEARREILELSNKRRMPLDAASLEIGTRVRVWWAGNDVWFSGAIISLAGKRGHHIRYDDGDMKYHDLSDPTEVWELEGAPSKAQDTTPLAASLVAVLHSGSAGAQEKAAAALANLAAGNAENQEAIVLAGAIEPLVALVSRGSAGAQYHAAGALCNLASDNTDNQVAVARACEIDTRVRVWWAGDDVWFQGPIICFPHPLRAASRR